VSHSCDETYTVYDERRVRARKQHRCAACREAIKPGHAYTRIGIVFDGCASTIKRCLRCQAIHVHLRKKCDDANVASRRDYDDMLWPDERLDCGLDYEEEWGELPDEIADLAFKNSEDMQKVKT
jgi:hypothetical protein